MLARRANEVLHDEEVSRETHRLHDVQLEFQPLGHLGRQRIAVTHLGAVHRQLGQIVGLQLYTIELVVPAQLVDLLRRLVFAHHHVAVLVARELVEQIALGVTLAILRLGAEILGNGERGHDGGVIDGVGLHAVAYLHRVGQRLGHVAEYGVHLGARLHPLLLRVEHSFGVVQILARTEAYQSVVRLGIGLVDEVHIVGTYQLYAAFSRQLLQVLVDLRLQRVHLVVRPFDGGFVKLELEIVILSEYALVPLYRLLGRSQIALGDSFRNLAAQTCRAADYTLVVLFQLEVVGTRTHIESLGPRLRYDLYEVMISLGILRQQNQVVAALVLLALLHRQTATGHIDLATYYRLEILLGQSVVLGLQSGYLGLDGLHLVATRAVFLLHIVPKLLYTEHVAVVGNRNAFHSVGDCLVDEPLNTRLTVQNGVLRMDMKMNEILHISQFISLSIQ